MYKALYFTTELPKEPRDFRHCLEADVKLNEGVMYAIKDMAGTRWEREYKELFYQHIETHIKTAALGKALFMTGLDMIRDAGIKPREWYNDLKVCGMFMTFPTFQIWTRDEIAFTVRSKFDIAMFFIIARSLSMPIAELFDRMQPYLDFYERMINGVIMQTAIPDTPAQEQEFIYARIDHAIHVKKRYLGLAVYNTYDKKKKWKPEDEKQRKPQELIDLRKKGILYTNKHFGKI